jgi:hypothetical protein
MAQRGNAKFEWHVLEDEDAPLEEVVWEQEVEAQRTHRRWLTPATRRLLVRSLTITLLTVVLAGGAWTWWRLRQAQALVRRDLQQTINQELLAWQTQDDEAFKTLLASEASEGWRRRELRRFHWYSNWLPAAIWQLAPAISELKVLGQHAEAQVIYQQDEAGPRFRETLYFHQNQQGGLWQRTAPDISRWGSPREAATAHFRFVYQARDAAAVAQVLPEIEAFYQRLQQDIGAQHPPEPISALASSGTARTWPRDDRIMAGADQPWLSGEASATTAPVSLTIAILPRTDVQDWRFVGNRLEIPSPELVRARADVPLSAELKRLLARPLADHLLAERWRWARPGPGAAGLLHALAHWEGEQWAGYGSWWWHAERATLQEAQAEGSDLSPTALGVETGMRQRVGHARNFFLVDYIATRFGSQRLMPLLEELDSKGWEEAVPTTLAVPYEDFAAGWQHYLSELLASPDAAP